MNHEQDPQLDGSQTKNELAQFHQQMKAGATGRKKEEVELPAGNAPVEARAEEPEEAETVEETPAAAAATETPEPEVEELIRIGDKEFKTQAEAIKYAETLAQEKLIAEAYNQGVHDHIKATTPAPEPEVEPPLVTEEEFFSDPTGAVKKTYLKAKEDAKREVLSEIEKQGKREALWNKFLADNPDIERRDAQRILEENWDTIGKMTDLSAAMKLVAQKTRAEYQRMAEKLKPRKELPPSKPQVISTGGGAPSGVTPPKKRDEPLDFASQLRMMKKRV